MTPVNVLVMIHGMIPDEKPCSLFEQYEALWQQLCGHRPDLPERIAMRIGVQWGHALKSFIPFLRVPDSYYEDLPKPMMIGDGETNRAQKITAHRIAMSCWTVILFSKQLETKQLPKNGKQDQYKCVNCYDREQFVATFLANDGSTHGTSRSIHLLFCQQAHADIVGLPGCSMQYVIWQLHIGRSSEGNSFWPRGLCAARTSASKLEAI